jgi:hypothetical protein
VFAVSRPAYERLGLFNPAMLPGPLNMLEMNLRYMGGRYGCKSVGVRKWVGWSEEGQDQDGRNAKYVERVYGVKP